jgi:hypothetical protein
MVLDAPRTRLRSVDLPKPQPSPGLVLLEVQACGVCRTDLHVMDGEAPADPRAARPRPPDRGGALWAGGTDEPAPAELDAQSALDDLCSGALEGAAVVVP